jgi:hypothetical protein
MWLFSDAGTLRERMACMTAIPIEDDNYYPDSDGEPMGESDIHIDEMVYVRGALKEHFQEDPDVYVAGNLLLYYRARQIEIQARLKVEARVRDLEEELARLRSVKP